MLKRLFGAQKPRDPLAASRIKAWAREVLADTEEERDGIAVTVSEIICTDPGCPGTETIILIMRPNAPSVAAKVAKPMEQVTESEAKGAAIVATR